MCTAVRPARQYGAMEMLGKGGSWPGLRHIQWPQIMATMLAAPVSPHFPDFQGKLKIMLFMKRGMGGSKLIQFTK